jgi:Spy/CpxP family protein refolding chaperone
MKRLGMAIGIWLMLSGIPAWGQSITVVTARQQTDAATAKAQADVARAKAQSDAAAARLRETERAAVRQEILPDLSVELQNSLTNLPQLAPFVQVTPSRGYNVQVNARTNDPLTALQVAPGTWWNNPETVTRLGLTKDQQTKMDDIFQKFRLTLIDLNAALSKEELIMDPLIAAEHLDEVKITAQIDKIAQARAELEKANSRMLLAIRQSLTMEQWTQIQASPGKFRAVTPRR